MNGFFDQLRRLGPARLGAMIAVTVALVGFFAFVVVRATQAPMGALFSDLSLEDSNGVIKELDSRGVRYELRRDGATILVPRADITRLRMELAGKGLPASGGVGYEIFDKGDSFSATNFVQNVNQLRALEGELSRSIRTLSRVAAARVHLVLPEKRLFERDREGPRASIVLKVRGDLEPGQVRAIRHLVASAVEGLKPERVSIVDEGGRLLADGASADGAPGVGFDERRGAIERRMKGQIEEIVASVVGQGRARVQVTAEMDFSRVQATSETFDPESRVVRSTQTRQEAASNAAGDGAVSVSTELPNGAQPNAGGGREASNKNEEIVNYEISRTTRTEVQEGGRTKRVSVAVLVDGAWRRQPGSAEPVYEPRAAEELERIAALVRVAIGFDRARGDQVEVANLRFAEAPQTLDAPAATGLMGGLLELSREDMMRGLELGILALLTLFVTLVIVRPMLRRMLGPEDAKRGMAGVIVDKAQGALAGAIASSGLAGALPAPPGSSSAEVGRMIDVAKVNGQIAAQSLEQVGQLVQSNPQETISVMRQWIHEPA